MAKQERIKYTAPKETSQQHEYDAQDAIREQEKARKAQLAQEAGRTAVEASEELLAEIDEVLETDAQEFVNGFLQQGGE